MNQTAIRHCVLYARLSVTKEESVSIDRQLTSCRKYAEARGWVILGEFIDDGVSATVNRPEDRKGWAALLAADGFDAVVIWKVDRLARRVLDFLHVDEALQQRGAGLVAVEDPIDMTSPQGRAFAVMLAVFGELEAASIRARVSAARAHLAQAGRFAGGGIPYGYRSVPNPDGPGRVLAVDPERIGWLTEIADQARRGVTVNAITRWLNEQGAPLPNRKRKRESLGWNRQTVGQLLRNPSLAGMTPRNPGRARNGASVDPFAVVRDENGDPMVDESLAVMTVDEFAALQQRLVADGGPYARTRSDRRRTSPFLSRVVLCDDCAVFLRRGTNQKRPVLYCPRCRQQIARAWLDPYLADRLVADRGSEPYKGATVAGYWQLADDDAKREILLSQLDSLRIRRGVAGRYFDEARVLLDWQPVRKIREEAA